MCRVHLSSQTTRSVSVQNPLTMKPLLTDGTSPLQPTKQSLAPGHGNMEDVLTALTSLIHSGKNIFLSEAGHALADLELQLPGRCGPYSVWKPITDSNRTELI